MDDPSDAVRARKRDLDEALRAYGDEEDPDARQAIEARLWEAHGRRCAVFISDLSGFSRLTEKYSIIHFLALICECRRLLVPVIEDHGGTLIKTTADNVYAVFPDAVDAIDASVAAQRLLDRRNEGRHPDWQIRLCVGVGYGEILVLEDLDFYGHQLNLAFKLGEDIAAPGEILVTVEAIEQAGTRRYPHELRSVCCSGLAIPHAAVHYEP